jgi:hypothetical protein
MAQPEDLGTLWESAQPEEVQAPQQQEELGALWESAKPAPLEFGMEQLKGLGVTEAGEPPEISGQTIGGIALPIAGLVAAPATGGASLIGLAAIGGAGGEAWEQVYNQFVEPEEAPQTTSEAAKRILQAGGEEAVYEVTGQVVGKVVGKAYHLARPKVAGGIDKLQETFSKYGGVFTAAERTESFLTQTVDSLVRGSLSAKGIMKSADDVNEAALKVWQKDLSDTIAESAAKNMPDGEFGELVKTTLKDGKAAFKQKTKELYSSFDDLVVTNIEKEMVEKQVATDLVDEAGRPITKTVISEISKEIRPVDVRPLKIKAGEILEKLERIKKIGIGDFGGKTITDILSLDDALRFSDAQQLRSTMLDIARGVSKDPKEAKLAGSINAFVDELTKSMDNAAKSQGTDVFKAYQKIKDTTEKGFKAFNDDVIVSMLKDKTASVKIGEMIFKDGNVDQVISFRRALDRAAKYDKTIDKNKVWEQTQQKYLESVFNSITKDIEAEAGETLAEFGSKAGIVSAAKLLKRLQDPKQMNTMTEMLGKSHREAIFEFAKAAGITQQKSVAGLSMLIQLTQAGAVMGTVAGRPGAAKMAATILIPTTVLAKMMTNPLTVRLMTSASKTPIAAKQIPTLVNKIMIAYENAKAEEEGRKRPIETILEPFTPKAL